jgi:hypothetical protein
LWECLKISFEPIYCEKAIIVIDYQGNIMGVSELATIHGFKPEHTSKIIEPAILKYIKEKDEYEITAGKYLLTKMLLVTTKSITFKVV